MKAHYIIFLLLITLGACQQEKRKTTSQNEVSMFTPDVLTYYQQTVDSAAYYLTLMDSSVSLDKNRNAFVNSRKWYKRAEPIIIAYDIENYKTLNGPNLLRVEIEDFEEVKILQPRSYQVAEEILFEDVSSMAELDKTNFQYTIRFLQARVASIGNNHMIAAQRDYHHLKMVRDAIVNIATKGITGFDSPMMANSLNEAVYNYQGLQHIIGLYEEAFTNEDLFNRWENEIKAVISYLESGTFDSFDRYEFIKKYTHKQLALINEIAEDWKITIPNNYELNPKADNIFTEAFFNKSMFAPRGTKPSTPERIALGKALFNDPNLSADGIMSCATCHSSAIAFTDGKKKAIGNEGQELLRNSMTLPYAVYQKSFFHDGSTDQLESQIIAVTNNVNEFHTDLNTITETVKSNEEYQEKFKKLYGEEISHFNIRSAIATYIRSLTPFDSKFDLNMQGVESSLTEEEIDGFNLFMGKAACATCHFPPSFHGTLPPKYMETELENLGVPANASFTHPVLDKDPGQYFPYEVEEKRGFFKTATVRNIEVTGPYMHNGVYETLEEVMNFYNVGGGAGMGLDVPLQTLPSDSLGLEDSEINAIIAFMKTLTDKRYVDQEYKAASY